MRFFLFLFLFVGVANAGLIQPSPVPLTVPDYQAQTQASVLSTLQSAVSGAVSGFVSIYGQLWNNPNLTPQQVFTAFGTNACQLVQISQNFQSTMNTLAPNSIPSPQYSLQINPDCTVTVGGAIPSPSPSPSN